MDLYNSPRNLFVAGFIGSPAMNFMPARVDGGTLKLPMADVPLPHGLPDGVADSEHPLIAGIRPEDFEDAALVGEGADQGSTFTAKIDILEAMGSELYAHFTATSPDSIESDELRELAEDSGAGEVPGAGQQGKVVTRLDPTSSVRSGQESKLWVNGSKVKLFDPQDGRSLTSPPGSPHPGAQRSALVALEREVREPDLVAGPHAREDLGHVCVDHVVTERAGDRDAMVPVAHEVQLPDAVDVDRRHRLAAPLGGRDALPARPQAARGRAEAAVELAPAIDRADDRVERDRLAAEAALAGPAEGLENLLEWQDQVEVAGLAPKAVGEPCERAPATGAVEVELRTVWGKPVSQATLRRYLAREIRGFRFGRRPNRSLVARWASPHSARPPAPSARTATCRSGVTSRHRGRRRPCAARTVTC